MNSRRELLRQGMVIGSILGACRSMTLVRAATDELPALPPVVIDSHTHFYDPSRPQGVPWPAPEDRILHRTVLPADWEQVVEPLGVTGTVVVEASPWVEDTQWLLDLAERHAPVATRQGIVAVIGNLPLGALGCAALIDRFAADRRFRGIRVNGDALLAGLDDRAYRADLGRLADHGLAIDVNHGDVFAAVDRLAPQFRPLRIVVDHLGGPVVAPPGPTETWTAGVERVAGHANVWMKVSAILESAVHASRAAGGRGEVPAAEAVVPWLDTAFARFGDGRLLFGSNWPVSDLAGSYADILGLVRGSVAARGEDAGKAFWAGAAADAYRWPEKG